MKLAIKVTEFRPFRRNTLRGFATVHVDDLHLTLHDVAVHQHDNGKRWIGLPSKPLIDSTGAVKRTGDGKIEYARLFTFDGRAAGDEFSASVVRAVLDFDPDALDAE